MRVCTYADDTASFFYVDVLAQTQLKLMTMKQEASPVPDLHQHASVVVLCDFRGHGVQAEGLPGLHSLFAAERRHSGPGGEGDDDAWSPTRLPGSLQQLRRPLPEPRPLRGASERLPVRLWPLCARRGLLSDRYTHKSVFHIFAGLFSSF